VEKAKEHLSLILADTSLDVINERLLIARTHEAFAKAYDVEGNEEEKDKSMQTFLQTYPQLVPYSDVRMKFHLKVEREQLDTLAQIEEGIANMSFDWQDSEDDSRYPSLILDLEETATGIKANLKMKRNGNVVMNKDLAFKKFEQDIHTQIMYTVFEIGNQEIEKPKEEEEEKKKEYGV